MASFPESIRQDALSAYQKAESAYLSSPTRGFNNPFARPGLTVRQLAFALNLVDETEPGRFRADIKRTRQVIKMLLADGLIESLGQYRTLSSGSRVTECFGISGMHHRIELAQQAWLESCPPR